VVIQLVDIEGFKLREAADIIGVPTGTVASRRFHGLRRLRVALEGNENEERNVS